MVSDGPRRSTRRFQRSNAGFQRRDLRVRTLQDFLLRVELVATDEVEPRERATQDRAEVLLEILLHVSKGGRDALEEPPRDVVDAESIHVHAPN
jgi:hypothetical protein